MKAIYMVILALIIYSCSSEDIMEKNRQELIDTDLAFSSLSIDSGMNHAFETYCAEEGVLLRSGSMPVVGIKAITDILKKSDDQSFELSWVPLYALMAKSGDLGYTYGVYSMSLKESDLTKKGSYVSIWIKEHGKWKFVLDTGNEGLGE